MRKFHTQSGPIDNQKLCSSFLSAFMLASKVLNDNVYSYATWQMIDGNCLTSRPLSAAERFLSGCLDWQLRMDAEILAAFEDSVRARFGVEFQAHKKEPKSSNRQFMVPQYLPDAKWVMETRLTKIRTCLSITLEEVFNDDNIARKKAEEYSSVQEQSHSDEPETVCGNERALHRMIVMEWYSPR